jgi:hypothetical protein
LTFEGQHDGNVVMEMDGKMVPAAREDQVVSAAGTGAVHRRAEEVEEPLAGVGEKHPVEEGEEVDREAREERFVKLEKRVREPPSLSSPGALPRSASFVPLRSQ